MTCYNEQGGATLTWEAAVDLHSPNMDSNVDCTSNFHEVKHQAVGRLRLIKCCEEEIVRFKDEMMNCMIFYCDKIEQLQRTQQHLTSGCTTRFNLGSLNLVQRQLHCDSKGLLKLQCVFSKWIPDFVDAVVGLNPLPLPIPTPSDKYSPSYSTSPPATTSSTCTVPTHTCKSVPCKFQSVASSIGKQSSSSPPVTTSSTHTVPTQSRVYRASSSQCLAVLVAALQCHVLNTSAVDPQHVYHILPRVQFILNHHVTQVVVVRPAMKQ